MIKTCKRCGEKFETNNKHRGRCDKCMAAKIDIEQPIKDFQKNKDIAITRTPFLSIDILNAMIEKYNPFNFFEPLEVYFTKCRHVFLVIPFFSDKGFNVDVLNNNQEFCDDCDKRIKEIANYLGNLMMDSIKQVEEEDKNAK